MKSLIIYHSKHGQTEKISHRIASGLETNRFSVVTHNINFLDQSISFGNFDLVVIGAPIYTTKHSKLLARFLRKHHDDLQNPTTAFFSVSLSAGGDEGQKDDARKCMEEFLEQANWEPQLQTTFAGALPYLEYGWFTRFLMKWIVKKSGGDTDTSKNYEYTDWKRVDRFADELVEAYAENALDDRRRSTAETPAIDASAQV